MPQHDHDLIERNFREIAPALSKAEAAFESNRCLYCFDAPCTRACPTHIDVPAFIKKIATANLTGAARVIFDANPIGATCARVCPVDVLCEGACVEGTLMEHPIEIGRLQRFATDALMATDRKLFVPAPATGKSVGIIGSGPAGISCATYLARLGHAVTVYERKSQPGGLNTYGMAEYKMTQATAVAEAERLLQLGVTLAVNTLITVNTETAQLDPAKTAVSLTQLETRHDALFIGVGLGATKHMAVDGETLAGVYDALHFIELVKSRNWSSVPLGKRIVVVGAGNTAIDAATQAKRLGAEQVVMIYRRTEREMPAYRYEHELAKRDGVEFIWLTTPVAILAQNDAQKVTALRCLKNELIELDQNGTVQSRPIEGTEFEIACDMVIKAVGQTKQAEFLSAIAGVELDKHGRVVVDGEMRTGNPRYFAGGDCVNGGAEAVDAAQHGKLAAMGIHRALTGISIDLAGSGKAAAD